MASPGCGGCHRSGPTGGAAKGTPRKCSIRPFGPMVPFTLPARVVAVVRREAMIDYRAFTPAASAAWRLNIDAQSKKRAGWVTVPLRLVRPPNMTIDTLTNYSVSWNRSTMRNFALRCTALHCTAEPAAVRPIERLRGLRSAQRIASTQVGAERTQHGFPL